MVNFQAEQEAARKREKLMGVLRAFNRGAPATAIENPAFQAKSNFGNQTAMRGLLAQREEARRQSQNDDAVRIMQDSLEWQPMSDPTPIGWQGFFEPSDKAANIDEFGDVQGDPNDVRMNYGRLDLPRAKKRPALQSLESF